ncbi:hypothetical protein [Streptomyces sp. NPDC049040]|uniref:hypothetical protein n=1 Tax=Streptomyces sp. NPDC049040 TaxID=3365593 RepID=UPI0037124694
MAHLERASGCVIYEIGLGTDPSWQPGPVPVRLPARPESADRDLRLTYFETRLCDVLYGSASIPVRWHRMYDPPRRLAGADIGSVEVLRMPLAGGDLGLAILHADLRDDPVAGLEALSRLAAPTAPGGERALLTGLLPVGASLLPRSVRARTVAHVTFSGGPVHAMSAAYAGWTPVEQWLWLLASATTEARFAPDPEDPAIRSGTVYFSADWKALVLRDGTAFVGTSPDPGGDCFHALARAHVHSIYLDALVVGCMQLHALNDVANRVAGVDAARLDAERLAELEHRLMHVRRQLWSGHITVRGKGNEVLRQFQAQHALPALLDGIVSELADAGRLVEAVTNRSVNAALGLLTVLGLPVGAAFAAAGLWGDPSPRLLLLAVLAAAAGSALIVAVVPPARQMLRTLWRRRPR